MSYPTVTVEIRFGIGPYDDDYGSTDLTDVSDKVLAFTTTSGRGNELEATSPGEASVTMDNQGRDFDPWYEDGEHYGQLLPGRQIRITATWDGTTYPVWAGWSEDWPQTYQPPEVADIQVPFVDALGLVATGVLPESVWADEVMNGEPLVWYRLGETSGRIMQDSSGNNRVGTYRGQDPLAGSPDGLIVGSGDGAVQLDPFDEWAICTDVRLGPAYGYGDAWKYEFWWRGDPQPGRIIAEYRLLAAGDADGYFIEVVYDSQYGLCVRGRGIAERALRIGTLFDTRHIYLSAVSPTPKLWINGVERTGDMAATGRTPKNRPVKGLRIGDVVPGLTAGATSHTVLDEVVVSGSGAGAPTTDEVAARFRAGAHPWQGDSTKARLNNVLGAVNLTSLQGPDAMSTTHRTWKLGPAHLESDAVSYVQQIEATEQGRLYTYFDGTNDPTLRLLEREPFEAGLPLAATFTDDPAGDLHYDTITMDTGVARIRNVITVNYPTSDGESKGTVLRSSEYSISQHGRRELTVDTLLSSASDGRNLAEFLLYRLADPWPRVTQLVFTPAADPRLWPAALSLKIGDHVQVVRSPQLVGPSIVADCRIDGIDHDASDGVDHWQTTLRLSSIDPTGWFVWGVTEWNSINCWYV